MSTTQDSKVMKQSAAFGAAFARVMMENGKDSWQYRKLEAASAKWRADLVKEHGESVNELLDGDFE